MATVGSRRWFRGSTIPYRHYGTWWKQILNRTTPQTTNTNERIVPAESSFHQADQIEPSQYLEKFIREHLPQYQGNWASAPLSHNIRLKTKVLLSCEKQFDCHFGDRSLGSIRTVQDVMNVISRPQKLTPNTVFPRIERTPSLPANLSVQAASLQPNTKKRVRQPFQNYNLPEHSTFLNKQQKEARKRKRRHLTAITKYYA